MCKLSPFLYFISESFIIDSWSSTPLLCCRKAVVEADIQGFNTNASKVASLVLGFFMLLILYWAYKSWTAWFSILITVGIIVICWLVASSVALRFFILFLGVMSCFYTIVCSTLFLSALQSTWECSWRLVGYHRCESFSDTLRNSKGRLTIGHITTESQYIRCVRIRRCRWVLRIQILGSVLVTCFLYL
jgi:hypothetical protein